MMRLRAWFAWESVLLFVICVADMLSTLYWVHTHTATEANPWMALWLERGDFAFCTVKLLSFLPLLAVAAYYRPLRPRLVTVSMRAALILYVVIYLIALVLPAFAVTPSITGMRDVPLRQRPQIIGQM